MCSSCFWGSLRSQTNGVPSTPDWTGGGDGRGEGAGGGNGCTNSCAANEVVVVMTTCTEGRREQATFGGMAGRRAVMGRQAAKGGSPNGGRLAACRGVGSVPWEQ